MQNFFQPFLWHEELGHYITYLSTPQYYIIKNLAFSSNGLWYRRILYCIVASSHVEGIEIPIYLPSKFRFKLFIAYSS